jgi:hypothetical protein
LIELRAKLEKESGLHFSTQHLWRVLKRMGFRLKKSRSTPANATRKRDTDSVKIDVSQELRNFVQGILSRLKIGARMVVAANEIGR